MRRALVLLLALAAAVLPGCGDGGTICSQRPSNEVVPLGARVRVELHEGPVKVFS